MFFYLFYFGFWNVAAGIFLRLVRHAYVEICPVCMSLLDYGGSKFDDVGMYMREYVQCTCRILATTGSNMIIVACIYGIKEDVHAEQLCDMTCQ